MNHQNTTAAWLLTPPHKVYPFSWLVWFMFFSLVCFPAIVFQNPISAIGVTPPKFATASNTELNGKQEDKDVVEVSLVQLNDVYEIATLDSGKAGGLARVATLIQQLKQQNPNVYTLLAGDFLFPSALGTLPYKGQRQIKGIQMLQVLNKVPVDLATFGNHEFDVDSLQFLNERIDSSHFDWISSNVTERASRQPFSKATASGRTPIPATKVVPFVNASGDTVRLGFLALTIASTQNYYVDYTDDKAAVTEALNTLKGKADVIIALTHLNRERDNELAKQFPEISLFIGGHEHVNSMDTIRHASGSYSYVAKADANVRTVYIHSLQYNVRTKGLAVQSKLQKIDTTLKEDADVKAIADSWNNWADSSWKKQGYSPCNVLAGLAEPLDGTEASVRSKPTNLTNLIAAALYEACGSTAVDASFFNSGSIRIDDSIKGRVTTYDIIRTLPYGGKIWIVQLKGKLLKKLLRTSMAHKRNGCFLQSYQIERRGRGWWINGKKCKSSGTYVIATNDYLAKGKQEYMQFFNPKNRYVTQVDSTVVAGSLRSNLILAVSSFVEKHYPKPSGPVRSDVKVPCY